jgi:hypothetical protein
VKALVRAISDRGLLASGPRLLRVLIRCRRCLSRWWSRVGSAARRARAAGSAWPALAITWAGGWPAKPLMTTITVDGLVEISHRRVLVTTHARQHPPEAEPGVWRLRPRARPVRPPTVGQPVVRKVDSSGGISFAGVSFRVGNRHRREQVEVRVVGDTVEISQNGTHDPIKAPAANPTGSTPLAEAAGAAGSGDTDSNGRPCGRCVVSRRAP